MRLREPAPGDVYISHAEWVGLKIEVGRLRKERDELRNQLQSQNTEAINDEALAWLNADEDLEWANCELEHAIEWATKAYDKLAYIYDAMGERLSTGERKYLEKVLEGYK